MKKFKLLVILLFGLSVIFISSCSNSPDNLKVIPAETSFISVLDIYSIIKKGQLTEISDLKFLKTLRKEIRSENKRVSKVIEKIIKDPTLTGINFFTDVFIFYINDSKDEKYLCLSAEIESEENFSEFIEKILNKSDIEFDIEKEKNYTYIIAENNVAIGWDNDKVIFLTAAGNKSRNNLDLEIETLFELSEQEQITANDEFNVFYSFKKDISFWLSSNLIEDEYSLKEITEIIDYDLSNNYMSAYLNFGDGNISLKAEFKPNTEIQNLIDENNILDNKFSTDLLTLFPNEKYLTTSISVNPKSFFNILEDEQGFEISQLAFEKVTELDLKDLFETLKGNALYSLFGFENLEYTFIDWGYAFNEDKAKLEKDKYPIKLAGYLSVKEKELLNQGKTIKCSEYSGRYCINIKNILENGGNVETAIENNNKIIWYEGGWEFGKFIENKRREFTPLMGLAFDMNGDQIIKKLIKKIPKDQINKRSDYYEIKLNNIYPLYFTFNKKICFFTNDKKSIKAFKGGGYSYNNLGNTDISSEIINSNFYSFINLNYDEYSKKIKKEIKKSQNNNEKKMYNIWNEFAKSLEIKQVDNNTIEIIFNSKEIENNSLKTIISTIDDNYKNFMSM